MNDKTEHETSENKTSLSEWKDATIPLAAFATSRGGTVHFGVSSEGKNIGIKLGKNTLENLANVSERQANYDLKNLVTSNQLIVIGKGRSTRYKIP